MELKKRIEAALAHPVRRRFGILNGALFIVTLISIGAIITHTFLFPSRFELVFHTIHWTVVIIFTLEYIVRLWCAPNKRAYVQSYMGLVDLAAILPTYLGLGDFAFLKGLRVARALRYIPVLELSRIVRYVPKNDKRLSIE